MHITSNYDLGRRAVMEKVQAATQTTATWLSVIITGAGILTFTEWMALGGLILGVISLVVSNAINFWFKKKMLEIERRRK